MPSPRYLPKRALLAVLALAAFLPVYVLSLAPGRGDRDAAGTRPVRPERMPRHGHLPNLTLLAVPALVLFLAVYFLGLVPAGSSSTTGPVHIEDVRINRLPLASSPRIDLEVELRNHDHVAHEIEAWWFLARPGTDRPWNLYAFRSSSQGPQTLAANETMELRWQDDVTAEPGTYELSVWVHTLEGDATRHSDGERLGNPTVHIDGHWSRFSRRATPPAGLHVVAVDLRALTLEGGVGVPAEFPLSIVVANDTAGETVADVRWFLYRRESRLPWNSKPAYTSRELRHQVFAPETQTTIETSEPISLWPGEYVLRVMVTEAGSEGSEVSDDLFLNDSFTVLESSLDTTLIRAARPSGPVEIASLAADRGSFQRGKGSVTVNLRNRSESKQEVILWWFLSRPGSLQPWVEFDLQSQVFTASIAPHQLAILDLSNEAFLQAGTYELSVWVHTLDGVGEEHPSDGAWFSRRIQIH